MSCGCVPLFLKELVHFPWYILMSAEFENSVSFTSHFANLGHIFPILWDVHLFY